ncbi:hypothetical protein [Sphingomonas lycopersici]|uniref:Uncharacterized protein n=1 Tax=Sphingomonas lycopersici TaxID=2951807 RepID=A0AA42CR87_9SPHN|nr:hypothetical protein [Sphingomonas lycopersici]MCW6536044.1 hypothetical protein [Sphingomonas lycopersici]
MNGIFSSSPASRSVRLVIGSNGLLLIQAAITWYLPNTENEARLLIVATCVPAIMALLFAIRGETRRGRAQRWGRRHAR